MQLSKVCLLVCLVLLVGCTAVPVQTYDYSAFEQSNPKSILIIPPLNESVEVEAPYVFLSTISRIVAEKGYYVFPVAVIDNYFKGNGLPTTVEMNTARVDKLVEHINPDAIMYVNINRWGQKFEIVQSRAVVDVDIRLIDSDTGTTIWESSAYAQEASNASNGGSLLEIILGAMLGQMAGSAVDNTQHLSRQANNAAVNDEHFGLPNGPYLPVEEPQP